jgi:hypothetical protein
MREIWIPELLIALFYLLAILRSPVKKLWPLDGLVWLPPLALGLSCSLFPAYGFRVECLPLALYGVVINWLNVPALRRRREAGLFVRGRLFTLGNFLCAGAVLALALVFAPREDTALDESAALETLRDRQGREYYLRLYEPPGAAPGEGGRPFLLLAPSPLGSSLVLDKLCGDLAARGFSVLSFSRRGFDLPAAGGKGRFYPPAPGAPSPGEFIRRLRLGGSATRLKKANDLGRSLEAGRAEDIEFILSSLRERGEGFSRRPLFLGGYGAGGSAAILLAASPEFCARNPNLRGIIAVESYLWSAYEEEEPPQRPLPSTPGLRGRIERSLGEFLLRLESLKPRKMAGPGEAPASLLPLLVILSDRSLDPRYGELRYGAIRRALIRCRGASLFAAAAGAGPLDYSDARDQYPLMPALFPGASRSRWNGGDYAGGAASLMAGFAALVLDSGPPGEGGGGLLPGELPREGLYLERRLWNLPEIAFILDP